MSSQGTSLHAHPNTERKRSDLVYLGFRPQDAGEVLALDAIVLPFPISWYVAYGEAVLIYMLLLDSETYS